MGPFHDCEKYIALIIREANANAAMTFMVCFSKAMLMLPKVESSGRVGFFFGKVEGLGFGVDMRVKIGRTGHFGSFRAYQLQAHRPLKIHSFSNRDRIICHLK